MHGGEAGYGTVFSLDLKGGAVNVVHSFSYYADGGYPFDGLTEAGGMLYGTTNAGGTLGNGKTGKGTVFKLDPTSLKFTTLHVFGGDGDGTSPYGAPTYDKGVLFGTTSGGGPAGDGVIFSLDLAGGADVVVHAFMGGHDGATPYAGLFRGGHVLYGVTSAGGDATNCKGGCGTVFSVRR